VGLIEIERAGEALRRVIERYGVELLPPEEQMTLFEITRRRFIEQRRADLAGEIATARQAYRQGQVRRGTVDDLMAEIGE